MHRLSAGQVVVDDESEKPDTHQTPDPGTTTPATKSRRRAPQKKVKPYMQRILDRIDAPAIVTTPTQDILAWNPLAAALMVDFGRTTSPSGHGSFVPAAIERASSVEVRAPRLTATSTR